MWCSQRNAQLRDRVQVHARSWSVVCCMHAPYSALDHRVVGVALAGWLVVVYLCDLPWTRHGRVLTTTLAVRSIESSRAEFDTCDCWYVCLHVWPTTTTVNEMYLIFWICAPFAVQWVSICHCWCTQRAYSNLQNRKVHNNVLNDWMSRVWCGLLSLITWHDRCVLLVGPLKGENLSVCGVNGLC